MSDFMITQDNGSKCLVHYGIKGQKWGDRKYQYEDGTLTPEGKERYYSNKERNKIYENTKNFYKKKNVAESLGGKYTRSLDYSRMADTVSSLKNRSKTIVNQWNKAENKNEESLKKISSDSKIINEISKKFSQEMKKYNASFDDIEPEILPNIIFSYTKEANNEYLKLRGDIDKYYNDAKKVTENIVGEYANEIIKIDRHTYKKYSELIHDYLLTESSAPFINYTGNHAEDYRTESKSYSEIVNKVRKHIE